MARISREQMFLNICEVLAQRSTCGRANVGALITCDNRIIGIGYNGPPSGEPHCKGHSCELKPDGGCLRSIHAEDNALRFIPRAYEKQSLRLYVSMSPCESCAEKIIAQGNIVSVYFRQEYRIRAGLDLLIKNNISVFRVTPAGHIIDAATNDFISKPEV